MPRIVGCPFHDEQLFAAKAESLLPYYIRETGTPAYSDWARKAVLWEAKKDKRFRESPWDRVVTWTPNRMTLDYT